MLCCKARGLRPSVRAQTTVMGSSLYCHVADISYLLALQVPRDYATWAASFTPHFGLDSSFHFESTLSWAPSMLGVLHTVTTFRIFKFLNPATDELALESCLAANISNCEAFFVPHNHSPSVSGWPSRHLSWHKIASASRKNDKPEKFNCKWAKHWEKWRHSLVSGCMEWPANTLHKYMQEHGLALWVAEYCLIGNCMTYFVPYFIIIIIDLSRLLLERTNKKPDWDRCNKTNRKTNI